MSDRLRELSGELLIWFIENQIILDPERDRVFADKLEALFANEVDKARREERQKIAKTIEFDIAGQSLGEMDYKVIERILQQLANLNTQESEER